MPFKCLKFWHKRQQRDGVVQPPRIAIIPDQVTNSHPQSSIDDSNACPTPDVSVKIQDKSAIVLPQVPDPTTDASQHALSTDIAVASPNSLTATPSSKPSSERLFGDLWNRAYEGLRTDGESTVKAYETLLDKRLQERDRGSPLPESTQIAFATLNQPEQLEKFVVAGIEESENIARAKGYIEEFGQIVQPVKAVMDVVVQAAPQASLAWSCISFALQVLANPLTESSVNREGIAYVLKTMKWYRALVDLLLDDDIRTQDLRCELKKHIVELYKRLLIYQMKSVCRYNRREIRVFLRDMVKLDDWKGNLNAVKDAEEEVRAKLQEYQSLSIRDSIRELAGAMRKQFNELASAIQDQTRTQQNAEDQKRREDCLKALRQMVDPQDEKERIQDEKGNLLRDCYSWILNHERYLDWHQNGSTKILWIAGDPGKGKTMLLCGIIDELEKKPTNILSYFFCQATQETLRSATAVLRGIIYGLAKQFPQLDHYVSEKYENGGGEAAFVGDTAWVVMRNILRAMLNDPHMDGVTMIVDALDECVEGRLKLLELICESSRAPDSRAKWIVSSRNWPEIEKPMSRVTKHTAKLSLELNDHVAEAVGNYIERKVEDLATEPPFAGNLALCKEVRERLNQNSEHTFLYVALVCKALREGDVFEERHVSGSEGILNEFPQGLDSLYGRMLGKIKSDTRASDKNLCKNILAVASVMKRHVSLQELCSIMASTSHFDGDLKTLESLVRCCGSFLNLRHGIVYFVHQSAVDFLHNVEKDAFKEIFPRGIKATHQDVFVGSIKATSKIVCRNIYGLRDSDGREALGARREKFNSPQSDPLSPIQYSCTYWIDHLSELGAPVRTDHLEVVHQFLRNKLLYWLEALALLRQLPQAIHSIQKLQKLVARIANPNEESLSEFTHDANRFLLYHRVMIEESPLQLYNSALIFSPEQSIVRKQFWFEAPDWVTVTQGVNTKWDVCLQTLFGHQGHVVDVAYSLDGQWLVSGDLHGTVKLWHVDSGICIHTVDYHVEYPVEHGELFDQIGRARVTSVAFSADGQSFTSAYASGLFKAFDRVRGDCIREVTALAHSEDPIDSWYSNRTVISKDSHTVACSLEGKSISLLKVDMSAPPRTFRPHSNEVGAVALSADGHFLATASAEGDVIEIWNTLTGRSTQITRNGELYFTLTFSADGRWLAASGMLAAVGGSHPVQVWESTTGQLALTLKHDMEDKMNPIVFSIAFSEDSNFVAASYGPRIFVWNTTTSALVWKSEEGGKRIFSLSFSPDALRLVSGSDDGAIKVWDLKNNFDDTSGSRLKYDLCYSDGLHFAASYPDAQEIEIWTGTTESDLAVKKFHEKDVRFICLSPDHRCLASSSSEGKITIWDTETGHQKQTFGGYSGRDFNITPLAFRGNSQIASCDFGVINIWDTSDGRHKQRFEETGRYIGQQMTFSADGQWLAYTSSDRDGASRHGKTVVVWDIDKERCFPVSIDKTMSVPLLSFSADSQLLALASGRYIYLWDAGYQTYTAKLEVSGGSIHNIQLCFDATLPRRLHTQLGFLDLIDEYPDCVIARDSEHNTYFSADWEDGIIPLMDWLGWPSFSGYGFSYDLGWVTQNQRKLFQIPFDYQAHFLSNCMTPVICGSTLIWISKGGRLLRMHFDVRV